MNHRNRFIATNPLLIFLLGFGLALGLALGAVAQPPEWQFVPSPSPPDQSNLNDVDGLASDDVWAVGATNVMTPSLSFDNYTLAEHWNGSEWQIVPTPSPEAFPGDGPATYLYAVEMIAPDDVWAGGTQRTIHSIDNFRGFQTLMMHWDGSEWSIVPTPETPVGGTGAFIQSIEALATDAVWAAGRRVAPELPTPSAVALVLFWDGSTWEELPTPPIVTIGVHEVRDLLVLAPDDIWIVGGHSGVAGGRAPTDPYVAHFDGESWTMFDVPKPGFLNYPRSIAGQASDDLWIVGDQVDANGRWPLLYHWDGSSWTLAEIAGFPWASGSLQAVTVVGNEWWAAGNYLTEPAPAVANRLFARYDGSTWSVAPAAAGGPDTGSFRGLATIPGGDLWAVGNTSTSTTLTERLTGAEGAMVFTDDFESGGTGRWTLTEGSE